MKQPCLDCGRISAGSRCEQHAAIVAERRQRRHQTRRTQRGGIRNRGGGNLGGVGVGATCWICGRLATIDDPMQWDHLVPVRNGGEGQGVLPAHRSCNIRRHHEIVKAERKAKARDDLDRRLMRGKHRHLRDGSPEGEGAQSVPGSNPAARSSG